MNFTTLFIKRPIMTTLVMVGILLVGVLGYLNLPVSDLPNVDLPTIQVTANLPGANPSTMGASVATPLEQQFSTIAGLDSMNSISTLGSCQITLQFNLTRNLDSAAQDVQAAISTAQRKMPLHMPTPPSLRKVNPADQPVLYLAVTSPFLPMYQVDDYAEVLIAQRLSMINGVAQVAVLGSQKYAVRVELDPKALATRNIGIDEATTSIETGNVNVPTGALYGNDKTLTLQTNGQLMKAAEYNPLIIAYRDGAPIHLSEVGHAIDNVEAPLTSSWFNQNRAIILAIQRQPGTNTIQVIDSIKKILPTFDSVLPPSVHLQMMFDRSETIRDSVDDVEFTLGLTIILVVLVIFLFLRSVFATLIASLALPMSIIGTFAAMALLNFSLDNLSLMALTLSVGFVVDDAIVMLENITRHMEMGKSAFVAALEGSSEIGFTIISMTLSLIAVFIPILFMGGVIGRLFNEFAVTITVAILVSGFVSLTLTPMLCSRFLKHQDLSKSNIILATSEKLFDRMTHAYERSLKKSLKHHRLVFLVFIILLLITGILFMIVPKGFMPSGDINQLTGITEAEQGISFPEMINHQKEMSDIALKDPNIQSVMSTLGTDPSSTTTVSTGPLSTGNVGQLVFILKPRSQRSLDADQVLQELRPKLANVPGIRIYLQNPPTIQLGGQVSKSLYQYTLESPNTDDLYASVDEMAEKMKAIPGLQDVNTDLQIKSPQLTVTIDRERASALGVSAGQIETALSDAYGTQQISTIYSPTNTYQVIVEVPPQYQRNMSALSLLYVRSANNNTLVPSANGTLAPAANANGPLVPLSEVAQMTQTVGPLTVSHMGQFPASTISFNLAPGASLGDVVKQINTVAKTTLPESVRSTFQGSAQVFQSSLQGLGWLLILAVLVIYLVLGILYESFIHPITILSGLPPAGLGALLTLYIFHKDLDLYGFLGLIMLIGIVKKNAIMMIDFALEAERHQNLAPNEAIYQACLVRFRPIMMTTLAALMGTLPIALGLGSTGSSRQSLGLAVFGGLMVSQLLTLYITPVLYIYLDALSKKFNKKRSNDNFGETHA